MKEIQPVNNLVESKDVVKEDLPVVPEVKVAIPVKVKEILPIVISKPSVVSDKPKTIIDEIKELKDFQNRVMTGNVKVRKMKLPRGARVKGRKLKKGYVGILKIDENGVITGEKQKVKGFTYTDSSGLTHATDGREILMWDGKFPVMLSPTWKNNPILISPKSEKNETYGQPYIQAKMIESNIKVKSKGGSIIIWIVVIVVALFAINYFLKSKGG